jgi:hypothetical protein
VSKGLVPPELALGYADGWPVVTPVGMFLDRIREGQNATVAALVAGLDPGDVSKWQHLGASFLGGGRLTQQRRHFTDFATALAKAEAEHEAAMVEVVRDTAMAATKDSWRAAAWLLEHQARTAPPVPEDTEDDDEIERYAEAVPASTGDTPD